MLVLLNVTRLLGSSPHSELSGSTLEIPFVCSAAGLGVKEVEPETLHTDAVVDGTGAAGPTPHLRSKSTFFR